MTQFYVNNFYIILGEIVGRQHCATATSVQLELHGEALWCDWCELQRLFAGDLKLKESPALLVNIHMDWQTLTHKTWSGVAAIMVLGVKPPRRQRQQQLACGEALQELSLDQPRRYQAELTSREGGGQLCLVTPVWRSRQVRWGDQTPGTKAGSRHCYIW